MNSLEFAAPHFAIVELMTEVASFRSDKREWLAALASKALQTASETPAGSLIATQEAAALRSVLIEIMETAAAPLQSQVEGLDSHGIAPLLP